MENNLNSAQQVKGNLVGKVLLWLVPSILLIALLIFLPAGTLNYWQAWVFLGVLLLPTVFVGIYLLKKDPEALQRRMKTREKDPRQQLIISLSGLILTPILLLPGFDKRWGWSTVPLWVVILADVMALLGYLIFFLVIRENRYASRVVDVEEGQKVISSGPYSIVRHPMYVGMLLMYMAWPLALGSFWAFLPALGMIPILVFRLLNEEKLLVNELPGYKEYLAKVKYRLLPGVW